MTGEYKSVEKKLDEDDPDYDAEAKPKLELKWNCASNITGAARNVNSVLDSEKMAAKANIDINNQKQEEVVQ